MNNLIVGDWLLSEATPNQPPVSMPGGMGDPMGANTFGMDPQGQSQPMDMPPGGQDLSQDPMDPDMPEDDGQPKNEDFEVWKNRFHKESVKGNVTIQIDLINQVRNRDLDPIDRKFVEDNLQIQYLRTVSNILEASKKIRRSINTDLDRNNPSTSIIKHMETVFQEQPSLSQQFIKMLGYYSMKGEIHRKYIAALTGAVQVSSGSDKEDIIVWDNDYSIMLSTRMNARFGDINIGTWALKQDDPHHFLSEPERAKLETGSPQEREALRHRVIIESIVNKYRTRGFIITVVDEDGTVHLVGWDLATSLKSAYLAGKLVVETRVSSNSECMMDEEGKITSYLDIDILYSKQTGDIDRQGKSSNQKVKFIERRNGMLFLVAPIDILKEASSVIPGLVVSELPYTGNPSDLKDLTQSVYSVSELLARQP